MAERQISSNGIQYEIGTQFFSYTNEINQSRQGWKIILVPHNKIEDARDKLNKRNEVAITDPREKELATVCIVTSDEHPHIAVLMQGDFNSYFSNQTNGKNNLSTFGDVAREVMPQCIASVYDSRQKLSNFNSQTTFQTPVPLYFLFHPAEGLTSEHFLEMSQQLSKTIFIPDDYVIEYSQQEAEGLIVSFNISPNIRK